jgi:hypothetical protein
MVDSSFQRLKEEFPSVEIEVLELVYNEEANNDYNKARCILATMGCEP